MQPPYSSQGAIGVYYNLQGLDKDGVEVVNPATGIITPFMNSGDPVSNTGWLDHYFRAPCDVYFLPASGPFSIAPMDTQRVVFAFIVGHDNSRLNSIVDLTQNVNFIRDTFLSEFKIKILAKPNVRFISEESPELYLPTQIFSDKAITSVQAQLFDYDSSLINTIDLYDDGQHNDITADDNTFGNV